MSTIELYNALVKAGVEDQKAKAVSESLVTFDDAKHFATKEDIEKFKSEFFKVLLIHTGTIIATVGVMLAFIK